MVFLLHENLVWFFIHRGGWQKRERKNEERKKNYKRKRNNSVRHSVRRQAHIRTPANLPRIAQRVCGLMAGWIIVNRMIVLFLLRSRDLSSASGSGGDTLTECREHTPPWPDSRGVRYAICNCHCRRHANETLTFEPIQCLMFGILTNRAGGEPNQCNAFCL